MFNGELGEHFPDAEFRSSLQVVTGFLRRGYGGW